MSSRSEYNKRLAEKKAAANMAKLLRTVEDMEHRIAELENKIKDQDEKIKTLLYK